MNRLTFACTSLILGGLYACTTSTTVYVVNGDGGGGGGGGGVAPSEPDAGAPPSTDASAARDATVDERDAMPSVRDGGTLADADAGKPWVGPTCARSKPNPAQFKWSSPQSSASCNNRDLAFITQQLQNGATYRSIQTRLFNQSCASCVFSEIADAAWGPVVFTNAAGSNGFKNFGGCYVVAGKSAACGQNYAKVDYCWRGVCDQCATQAELDTCLRRSSTEANGPCFSEYNAADASCGGLAGVVGCTDLFQAIQTMCGSGQP